MSTEISVKLLCIKAMNDAYEGLELIGGTLKPDEIFGEPKMKAKLVKGLSKSNLLKTTLGEALVQNNLLSDSQLNIIKVIIITTLMILKCSL